MATFVYGAQEIDALKKKDKRLARAIDAIGKIERDIDDNLFVSLVSSIAGQQISTKAAKTVWARLESLGEVTPSHVAALSLEAIQQCGMSMRKATYIKELAQSVVDGGLDLDALWGMSDADVIQTLTKYHGIGAWTAEMILIFCMQRPDVVSFGDFAIRKGLCNLYHHKELTKEQFLRYKKRYSPYGSIASLYLWEIATIGLDH